MNTSAKSFWLTGGAALLFALVPATLNPGRAAPAALMGRTERPKARDRPKPAARGFFIARKLFRKTIQLTVESSTVRGYSSSQRGGTEKPHPNPQQIRNYHEHHYSRFRPRNRYLWR